MNRSRDNRKSVRGAQGFESFYQKTYTEQWPQLREKLTAPATQIARINAFCSADQIDTRARGLERLQIGRCQTLALPSDNRLSPQADQFGINDFYLMDAASIYPAINLDVRDNHDVLDLCAAPGGKTLILAEGLRASGSLTANELSPARRARLSAVMHDYLPPALLARIRITGFDGSRWGLNESNHYDRVLLDAPCSGERHLLANNKELSLWSESRSKSLAIRQYALLASALSALKPGGVLVYSTCSLSPYENDEVVAKLNKRRGEEWQVLEPALPRGQRTEYGHLILPIEDHGAMGPIYFAVLQKK